MHDDPVRGAITQSTLTRWIAAWTMTNRGAPEGEAPGRDERGGNCVGRGNPSRPRLVLPATQDSLGRSDPLLCSALSGSISAVVGAEERSWPIREVSQEP